MRTIADVQAPGYSYVPVHEINVGERLVEGTIASIKGAASPKGAVLFTFTDGTTATYGSNVSDSTLVTSHSLTLNSLTCNTTYHYQISSVGSAGSASTAVWLR